MNNIFYSFFSSSVPALSFLICVCVYVLPECLCVARVCVFVFEVRSCRWREVAAQTVSSI